MHAFIYMIFMLIASKIMTVAPLLALLFIRQLEKSEKVIRGLFRIEDGAITAEMDEAGDTAAEKTSKILNPDD